MMLILVFRHHFCLQDSDLGINYTDSFLRTYFRVGCTPKALGDLTEAERERLRGWIKQLFESEGISDELMSTCGPKEFHLLVATLFDQSLKAYQSGALTSEAIKGAFECESRPTPPHSQKRL